MRKFLAIVGATLTLAVAVLVGQTAHAAYDPFAQPCIDSRGQSSVCEESKKSQDPNGSNSLYGKGGIISKVITILDIIIGSVAVVMIMIAGFKFVTSNGDSNNVTSARNTIIYAIVGIIVALSGQLIVQFVLNRL